MRAFVFAAAALAPGALASADHAPLAELLGEVRAWQSRGLELEAKVLELQQEDPGDDAAVGDALVWRRRPQAAPAETPPFAGRREAPAFWPAAVPVAALELPRRHLAWAQDEAESAARRGADAAAAEPGGVSAVAASSGGPGAGGEANRVLPSRDSEQFIGGDVGDINEDFMTRPCVTYWVGSFLCRSEKVFHWVLAELLLNPVTFVISLIGCTLLNTVGYSIRMVHDHGEAWRALLSAVVVVNFFHLPLFVRYDFPPALVSYGFILLQVFFAEVSRFHNKEELKKWVKESWIANNEQGYGLGAPIGSRSIALLAESVTPDMMRAYCSASGTSGVSRILPFAENTPADMVVTNKYREVSQPFSHIIMYFFAQGVLMLFYTYEVMLLQRASHSHKLSCVRWLVAVVLCYIAGEDQLGGRYSSEYFELLLKATESIAFLSHPCSHHFPSCCRITFKQEWRVRSYLAFLVNGLFRTLILGTAPVMLAASGPLSFIKDCLALFFITKLDDLDNAKSMSQELRRTHMDVLRYESRLRPSSESSVDGDSDGSDREPTVIGTPSVKREGEGTREE